MRTKKCRAVSCPRYVNNNELFCNVHLNQITPRLLNPISNNREAPSGASPTLINSVNGAVNDAVTYIAKLEGRAGELANARRAQSFEAGQGGQGGAVEGGSTSSASRGSRTTSRPDIQEY